MIIGALPEAFAAFAETVDEAKRLTRSSSHAGYISRQWFRESRPCGLRTNPRRARSRPSNSHGYLTYRRACHRALSPWPWRSVSNPSPPQPARLGGGFCTTSTAGPRPSTARRARFDGCSASWKLLGSSTSSAPRAGIDAVSGFALKVADGARAGLRAVGVSGAKPYRCQRPRGGVGAARMMSAQTKNQTDRRSGSRSTSKPGGGR